MNYLDGYLVGANIALVVALSASLLGWRRAVSEALDQRRCIERKHRDELRRAQAELARSKRVRATFLAAANHDLRQPLQAMTCFSAVLAKRLRGRSREVARHLQHSLDIVNSHMDTLADLSRLEAELLTPNLRRVPASALLADLAEAFAPAAAAKGLRLSLVSSELTVVSDADLLRRLLCNLIDNAVRFTDRGGIVLGCRRRGAVARFEVWDSGTGVAEEHVDRIFEEFYQVGNSQRDRGNGLGVGLAVVDRLVRLLPGHRIEVASRPGRGSLFAVQVPLVDAAKRYDRCAEVEVPRTAVLG